MPKDPTDFSGLHRGLLEFLILAIVSSGEVYAADMIERLEGTPFATREGTLYPLLGKLRRTALVDYTWRESDMGPPRKYYRLTASGQQRLDAFRAHWQATTTLFDRLSEAPWNRSSRSA